MAKGRMVKRNISNSRLFAALDSWIARTLYLMLFPWADREGRMEADPEIIRGNIVPRLKISKKMILECLKKLDAVRVEGKSQGLIMLYEVNSEKFLEITDFKKHQTIHHREPISKIPEPFRKSQENTGKAKKVPPELELEKELELEAKRKALSKERESVVKEWKKWVRSPSKPGLINHSQAYFDKDKTKGHINAAIEAIGTADVIGAIRAYGYMAQNPKDFRWSYYEWPIDLFLKRGLERFKPSSEPLKVYKSKKAITDPRRVSQVEDKPSKELLNENAD